MGKQFCSCGYAELKESHYTASDKIFDKQTGFFSYSIFMT